MNFEEYLVDPTPVTDRDIARIEALLHAPLPADYVAFARIHGGAAIIGVNGQVTAADDKTRWPLFKFYGGGTGDGSLWQQVQLHDDLTEMKALPMARDMAGNLFVLEIAKVGKVSYIDYYAAGGAKAYKIGDRFSDFLKRIEVLPYSE